MSSFSREGSDETTASANGADEVDPGDEEEILRARLELLEEENRRLREEYVRARQASYRRTAGGLALIGTVGVLAGVLFPSVRELLLVLGAIGLFGGLLTYYLTPERFVTAETGERIARAQDDTHAAIAEQLGLANTQVYVPVTGTPSVRVFVPQHEQYALPNEQALAHPFVVGDGERERGLSVVPAGSYLFEEFERTLTGQFGDTVETATSQLADGLVEGFELATSVEADADTDAGRVTVQIDGRTYDSVAGFENPLASFIAVGLSQAVDAPIRTELTTTDESEGELLVTCRWDTQSSAAEP